MQVHSQLDSIRQNIKFSKNLTDKLDTKECKEFRIYVHSVQQTTFENLEKTSLKLETKFASRSMTYIQEGL